jgi:hypothetical protein
LEQLVDGGVIVLPLWLGPGLSLAVAFEKAGDELVSRELASCGFMPLRGGHGGPRRRQVLEEVPWDGGSAGYDDDEIGTDGARPGRWLALFDDATEGRRAALTRLLREPATLRRPVTTFPGWNLRLALEQPDPIWVITMVPPRRQALGLFDAGLPSLAVLEGESLWCFGHSSCGDRMAALLSAPVPLDLGDLRVNAVPHGSAGTAHGQTTISRPSFDFVVREGRGSIGPP